MSGPSMIRAALVLRGWWSLPIATVVAVAVSSTVGMSTFMASSYLMSGYAPSVREIEEVAVMVGPVMVTGVALGFVMLGLPFWVLLHIGGHRDSWSGAMLGAILTALVVGFIACLFLGFGGLVAGLLAIPSGAAGGWSFMRIVYAPASQPKPVVSLCEGAVDG